MQIYERARKQGQWIHAVRCLEGLAEWALASGELQAALKYSGDLQELAEVGGMRENAARARKYWGDAFTALGDFNAAENELKRVEKMADEIKGARLQWDVQVALEKLYRAWGIDAAAEAHQARVIAIVNQIREYLKDDELKAGLPLT